MENQSNGKVSYAVLRRLLEKAWEDKEIKTLQALSSEIDAATVRLMEQEAPLCSKAM